MVQTLRGTFLVVLGYMLSPLSWWNDVFFNLPIAYGVGYGVSLIKPDLFFPATIIGYWLSNVLGFVLMQFGVGDVAFKNKSGNLKRNLLISLGTSTLYTLAVVLLFQYDILETPKFITQFSQP